MSEGNQVYGWYDSATQTKPTYDPPHDAPCIACGFPITPDNVCTTSMMIPGEPRSYFYRTHRTCANAAPENSLDEIVWQMIEHKGN